MSRKMILVFGVMAIIGSLAKTGITEGLYTLRFNIVEWSPLLEGAPFSRNVGPTIRKGMAEGTVTRTSASITFRVEWRQGGSRLAGKNIFINGELKSLPGGFTDRWMVEVVAKNGQATISLDPALIGEETELHVWSDTQFSAPPDRLPLVTNPGELNRQVKGGVRETYLHFILPPKL